MKKFIILLYVVTLCACATQSFQPAELQTKIATGMSVADVISTLDIPTEKKIPAAGQLQLIYPGYIMNFTDGKLTTVQSVKDDQVSELSLKPVEELKPGYKTDSIVLNKDLKPAAGAFRVAGYLQNETLFVQAVEAGVYRNGFTMKTNALCVAMTEGYLKGAEAIFKVGYYPDVRLRTDQGTYIFPKNCLEFQKDPAVAEQLKKMLAASEVERAELAAKKAARLKAAELKPATSASGDVTGVAATGTASGAASSDASGVSDKKTEIEDEDSKFSFDWQAVKDFLKPSGVLPDGKHPEWLQKNQKAVESSAPKSGDLSSPKSAEPAPAQKQ